MRLTCELYLGYTSVFAMYFMQTWSKFIPHTSQTHVISILLVVNFQNATWCYFCILHYTLKDGVCDWYMRSHHFSDGSFYKISSVYYILGQSWHFNTDMNIIFICSITNWCPQDLATANSIKAEIATVHFIRSLSPKMLYHVGLCILIYDLPFV